MVGSGYCAGCGCVSIASESVSWGQAGITTLADSYGSSSATMLALPLLTSHRLGTHRR